MSRRPRPRPPDRPSESAVARHRQGWFRVVLVAGPLIGLLAALGAFRAFSTGARLRDRARAAEAAANWQAAANLWNEYNASPSRRDTMSLLREARSRLALGHAARAQALLERACALDPAEPRPWLLRLELLRIQSRMTDALRAGNEALAAVAPGSRRDVLRDLTLCLLADLPDAEARRTLQNWVAADPEDVDSEAALFRRIAANPAPEDASRPARIDRLEQLLSLHPENTGVREALLEELGAAGEPERGRALLDGWPAASRDARYDRLLGRWQLDYEGKPEQAVESFRRALEVLPHDNPTRYRLTRALQILGRTDQAREQASRVQSIREVLDPARLQARLEQDLGVLNREDHLRDLAALCRQAGLEALARGWDEQAAAPPRL